MKPVRYKKWKAEWFNDHWRLVTPCGDDHTFHGSDIDKAFHAAATATRRAKLLRGYVDSGKAAHEHHCLGKDTKLKGTYAPMIGLAILALAIYGGYKLLT